MLTRRLRPLPVLWFYEIAITNTINGRDGKISSPGPKRSKVEKNNLNPILAMLKPIDTLTLFNNHPEMTVPAGTVIFKEGETALVMYGLLEGTVEMNVKGKLVETLKTGDVFGEGALVHQDHLRTSTAIAKTDCVLVEMNRERFMFAVQQAPMFALELLRSYSDRFRRLKERYQALL